MSRDPVAVRLTVLEIHTIRAALEAYYRERPDDRRRGLKRLQDTLGDALARRERARKVARSLRTAELKMEAISNRVAEVANLAEECRDALRDHAGED